VTTTATRVQDIPVLTHKEAMALAATEYERYGDLIADLAPGEWSAATVCTGWDPADITRHLLGELEMSISFRENVRQLRVGKKIQRAKGYDHFVHGVNELQVAERETMGPAEIVATWRRRAPKALRARRRFPRVLRPLPAVDFGPILGRRSLAYMVDRVLTRDPWMHRIDICRALGRAPVLTPEHDGRIVADMVLDWALTHGHAFELELTGPAGGTFSQGTGGDALTIDAIEWIWILSGRSTDTQTGLLAKELPL
jgi:uncharacterized protein (TIGR03083 family)